MNNNVIFSVFNIDYFDQKKTISFANHLELCQYLGSGHQKNSLMRESLSSKYMNIMTLFYQQLLTFSLHLAITSSVFNFLLINRNSVY